MSRSISRYGAETVIMNELGEPCFRRCITADGKVTKDIPVSERGFVKELEVSVILKRSYVSEADFKEHIGFFVQKYKLKMPSDRYLQFAFFKYEPKSMGCICIRNFDTNVTFSIEVMNEDNQKEFGIRKVGKVVKISAEKAQAMLRDKEVLGLFNDNGENIVIV